MLYQIVPSRTILDVAEQCGDWLVKNGKRMNKGLGWINSNISKSPLTGFSHGAAGIAWSLLDLYSNSYHSRYKDVALQAIEYERSLFSIDESNWPDLREFRSFTSIGKNGHQFMVAWCHGATGIGLSRLSMLHHLNDADIFSEISAAINTTISRGFGYNHSLCHGDLGNLELLTKAWQILKEQFYYNNLEQISSSIINSINTNGPVCANPLGVESPGLMTGLAGIGYGLLRLARPSQVPSILLLEPPIKN